MDVIEMNATIAVLMIPVLMACLFGVLAFMIYKKNAGNAQTGKPVRKPAKPVRNQKPERKQKPSRRDESK